MAQPFSIGDVVGGRYRITHHVVTSADQDIVFQAVDQVLNRDVSVLLASTANAKQVATSARELATGDRKSDVQVLDLGLSAERTYLIATLTHPNDLLDLVVPDAAPYVEPFFTDSLGQELFGQSRVMEPETYADDEVYYAELQDHLAETEAPPEEDAEDAAARVRRRRPAFLSKMSDSINRRLRTDRDADRIAAGDAEETPDVTAAQASSDVAGVLAGQSGGTLDDLDVVDARTEYDAEESFSAEQGAEPVAGEPSMASDAAREAPEDSTRVGADAGAAAASTDEATHTLTGSPAEDVDAPEQQARNEEVVDDPPAAPLADMAAVPAAAGLEQDRPSFSGLIAPIGTGPETSHDEAETDGAAAAAAAGGAGAADGTQTEEADESSGSGRWVALLGVAAVVLIGAVVAFMLLRGAEAPDSQAGSEESATQETTGEASASETASESPSASSSPSESAEPEPLALNSVTREVPDSPGLNSETDGELPSLIDGDTSSAWTTLNYGSAGFGGYASNLDLVVELEESSEITAVTLTQEGEAEGGSFEVLVGDSASGEGAETVGSGTWNWTDTTIELDEPAAGQYVIIRTTELPLQTVPSNGDLPYSLAVSDIEVEGR